MQIFLTHASVANQGDGGGDHEVRGSVKVLNPLRRALPIWVKNTFLGDVYWEVVLRLVNFLM